MNKGQKCHRFVNAADGIDAAVTESTERLPNTLADHPYVFGLLRTLALPHKTVHLNTAGRTGVSALSW
jgi:hypothetical protein